MQKVVLATGNPGKVRELASLLADFGLDIVAQTELGVDSAEETGLTFIENAILKARPFTQDEPFVVLYGDDVIMGEDPVAAQLCRAYAQYRKACVGIKEVSPADIVKYSSMKLDHLSGNLYNITDMIEKPALGQEFSLFSILGRCLLTPEIYSILEKTQPGAGGEIQLTDAMAVLARRDGMTGVDFTGKRYDMGNKLGVMEAQVETALTHPEIGPAFRAYLKELSKTL